MQRSKNPVRFCVTGALFAGFICFAGNAMAQSGPIDPKAMDLLRQMSSNLANAKALSFETDSLIEVPTESGQWITLDSEANVLMRRPDGLRVRFRGGAPNFDFYFDGVSATAYAPGTGTFSKKAAPETIDLLLAGLEEETGIRLVSAPLLFSNPMDGFGEKITRARVIGETKLNGKPCWHLALQSPGVDWEIWITTGAGPVPLRLATTFTDVPNRKRTVVEFSKWNLSARPTDSAFAFTPPNGSEEIPYHSGTE